LVLLSAEQLAFERERFEFFKKVEEQRMAREARESEVLRE
jgi:hypothetical protein